jgi:hypothetical protein
MRQKPGVAHAQQSANEGSKREAKRYRTGSNRVPNGEVSHAGPTIAMCTAE